MTFSQNSAYLLVLSPMLTENVGNMVERRYEFKPGENGFEKCLYLASFMAKQKFPIPKTIYIREDLTKASSYSASAIKYASGPDWKNTRIDASVSLNNNVSKHIEIAQQFGNLATGDLLMIVDNAKNEILRKTIDTKVKPGDALLFVDKTFNLISQKIEAQKPTNKTMLIENLFANLHGWDEMDISEDCCELESEFHHDHTSRRSYPSYSQVNEDDEGQLDDYYNKLRYAQSYSNRIDNAYGIGSEYFAQQLNRHIKTFDLELYAMQPLSQAGKIVRPKISMQKTRGGVSAGITYDDGDLPF